MNEFLNISDYSAIAWEFLKLSSETRYNYIKSKKAKYYNTNDNMFELIANEIGKIKQSHLDRLSRDIIMLLQMGMELDFEIEIERLKEQSWMPAMEGGHNFNTLKFLEQWLRDYDNSLKIENEIEADRVKLLLLEKNAYRLLSKENAIENIANNLIEVRGKLFLAQVSKLESIDTLKATLSFWENELIYHDNRVTMHKKQQKDEQKEKLVEGGIISKLPFSDIPAIDLTHRQIALLYYYLRLNINDNNAKEVALKHGQTSGKGLMKHVSMAKVAADRRNSKVSKASIEKVIQIIKENGLGDIMEAEVDLRLIID